MTEMTGMTERTPKVAAGYVKGGGNSSMKYFHKGKNTKNLSKGQMAKSLFL